MFARLLLLSLLRQRRRQVLAGAAIMLGMAIVTAMISVSTEIGDKMNAEIRSLGANIIVYPQEDSFDVQVAGVNLKPASDGAFLNESDLIKIKQIFWAHNIRGYTPMLDFQVRLGRAPAPVPLIGTYFAQRVSVPSGIFETGVRKTHSWWKVEGAWPEDGSSNVLLGRRLATRLGLRAGGLVYVADRETRIAGILSTGGPEEDAVVAPLALAQQLMGRANAVRRVYVSALTKPEDDFARRDPKTMSPEMLERWSCSPYANSIAYQIRQAIPGAHAEQIRAVAQNEGVLLSRISGLMLLVGLAAILAAGLAVSASVATTMLERRQDIGVMRSLGASRAVVGSLLFAEAALLAVVGASIGFLLGGMLARRIAFDVFGSGVEFRPVLFPVILLIAIAITVIASTSAIVRALRSDPASVLRGEIA